MRHARGERGMIGLAAAVASVVIVAVIGGALLVHAYSDTVRNLTRKDSIGYLADISSQITENVRTVTSQIFSAMETIERRSDDVGGERRHARRAERRNGRG